MKKLLLLIILVCNFKMSSGQNPDWIVYNSSNSGLPDNWVPSIAIDQFNNKWIGTVYGGVAKFDNINWTIYNQSNSGLYAHNVQATLVDPNDYKWFGSGWIGRLSRFDNNNWVVFDSSNTGGALNDYMRVTDFLFNNGKLYVATLNFGLVIYDGNTWADSSNFNSSIPGMFIYDLAKDNSGNIWLAHWNNGLTKFDGTSWTNYNTSNSILPSNDVTSVAIESNGIIWATTRYDGLLKIDGNTWTLFTTSNSGLPSNSFNRIMIDSSNVKWIATGNGGTGTGSGLVKYDDITWTVYDTSNSNIPSNDVISILIDSFDNKWIGTQNDGLAVFRQGGVILSNSEITNNNFLYNLFPNPSRGTFSIDFANIINKGAIDIYNILGENVFEDNIINESKKEINLGNISQGIYYVKVSDERGHFAVRKIILE